MPGGRPTDYKPEYCEEILKYFRISVTRQEVVKKIYKKDGTVEEVLGDVPNDIPLFEGFAVDIADVCMETLEEWKKVHKEFSLAFKKCKLLQKRFLITNGIKNLYNPAFAIFTAKNITDMRDQTDFGGPNGELVIKMFGGKNFKIKK